LTISSARRRLGWLLAVIALIALGTLSRANDQRYAAQLAAVQETQSVKDAIHATLSSLKDAETGQRGYVLTGDEQFMEPYLLALHELPYQMAILKRLVARDPQQLRSVAELQQLARVKLTLLSTTIDLRRAGRTEEALDMIRLGAGKRAMDSMRRETAAMLTREQRRFDERSRAAELGRQELAISVGSVLALVACVVGAGVWSTTRGIQDERKATERLRESEQELRRVADNAADLVRILGPDSRVLYVSPSCERLLGYSQQEILDMEPRALMPEEEKAEARELADAIRTGLLASASFTHRLIRKDGIERWFETTLGSITEGSDSNVHVHLTSRDVTERHNVQQELRRQTARLTSILTSMHDGVVVLDSARTVLLLNQGAHDFIRERVGQKVPSAWADAAQATEIDGSTPFASEKGPLTRALSGEAGNAQMILNFPGKEQRAVSITASPIRDAGVVTGCVAVYRDITAERRAARDLQESEERMRVLSDASFEGVAISRAAIVVDCNENFASWLGYSRDELLGKEGFEFFHPDDLEMVRRESARSDGRYEARLRRKDGSFLPVEVRGRSVTFRGQPSRIAVIRDVTERLAREAEAKAHAEALRAMSLRDELTGLYNRRGFLEHAEQALRRAARQRSAATVFFADLNGMKGINDNLGHEMGDRAIVATGRVLGAVFREADIIARLGGDEFSVFAPECQQKDVPTIRARLEQQVALFNEQGEPFRLSISIGASTFEPGSTVDLAELMELADRKMYDEKRGRTAPTRGNLP
jgi:diguanylate cyclase (GGDEF)-like protein/PAS domain S-box-containing protein